MSNPVTYPHRYNKEYLEFVLSELKDEKKMVREAESKEGENKKCIRIDFCGLAATNLLGIELSMGENQALRKDIRDAFKNLLKAETINKFSNEAYIKVRFCFSYLYSDFVTSLIKAEKDELWDYIKKHEYHYNNKPLEREAFNTSRIYNSQNASLRELSRIIKDNKDLIPVADRKEHSSLQIRFAVIPSSLCLLVINNSAIFDTYLYAKDESPNSNNHISLLHPVAILNSLTHEKQYKSFRDHWKYLWMHDLTLFCGDATNFSKKNIEGIQAVNSPEMIKFQDKINRMKNDKKTKYTKNEIGVCRKKWKQELKHHTSRIIEQKNIVRAKIINKVWLLIPLMIIFYGVSFFIHMKNIDEHILFAILMTAASFVTILWDVFRKWIKDTYLSD